MACGLTLRAMRTFDAMLPTRGFWTAVVVPPVLFLLLVQGWGNGIAHGEVGLRGMLFLMALAQAMPLTALGWMLFSTAAYSVGNGKIVLHSVIADREFPFENISEPPQLHDGVITLRLPRRVRLRVKEPQRCLDVLRAALTNSGATSSGLG